MKNKKADLPITILVIGVVFVCGLAIFSFYVASQNFEKDFNSVLMMQEMNHIERMNQFYRQVGDEGDILPKINEELKSGNFVYVLNKAENSCEFVGNYSVSERSWIIFTKKVQKAIISRKVAC